MIYLFLALLSALLTYLVRLYALKRSILDIPNHRSSHETPTPRGGGVAIVVTFFIGLWFMYERGSVEAKLFYAILASLPVALTGALDDMLDLTAFKRFLVQVFSAVIALYFLELPWYLNILGFFILVWFTNLFNFLDGIDGYVSIEALFISISAYILFQNPLYLVLGASVVGFLPYNWQKASIFMGDVGSTFIGFIVAVFILYDATTLQNVLVWALLTSPFWFDATYTLLRRLMNRENITQAHRKHLFQRAVRSGFSHKYVALVLSVINLFIILSIILLHETNIVLLLPVLVIIFTGVVYFIEKRVPFEKA